MPAGARLGARCFAYMLSHSLFSRKVFYLYWKAEYLLIPRNWQSGFKVRSIYLNLRALLFLPHHEANGHPFLLFTPPTSKLYQFLYHLQAMTSELFSSLLTKLSSLKSLGPQPFTVHLYVPSHKVLSIWSLIYHGFALGQMTSEVIKQIRWQIRGKDSAQLVPYISQVKALFPLDKRGLLPYR